MRADAGLPADPTRRQIGQSSLDLATRPLLPQYDSTALILANDVERVLADIDADYIGRSVELLWHGVLLAFGAPCQHSLPEGREHGRTILLADLEPTRLCHWRRDIFKNGGTPVPRECWFHGDRIFARSGTVTIAAGAA